MTNQEKLKQIREEIKNDPQNAQYTAKGYEPVYTADSSAKIAIVGQAPGIKAQESQTCFNDRSGDRLRDWLGVDRNTFYDATKFAILPMDFYYPGKAKTGDLPPRKGFAEQWHPLLFEQMPEISLILLVGLYSQKFYLKESKQKNLTETVKHYQDYLPKYWPLVHPSPLNGRWLKKNPWFEREVIPQLQKRVRKIIHQKASE